MTDEQMREQVKAAAAAPLKSALYINIWVDERSGYGPDPDRRVLVARKGRGPSKGRGPRKKR